MQQIVALVKREVAALFLEGAKAGEIQLPFSRIWAQEIAQEVDHMRTVVPQDVMQMRLGAVIAGKSAHHVIVGPIRDIFVQPQLIPFARK